MKVLVTHSVPVSGADVVLRAVAGKPTPVIGLATGSSPLGVYEELSRRRTWTRARAFALDEYVGLPPRHPQSYFAAIASVADQLGIPTEAVHVPNGSAEDLMAAAEEYEEAIRRAGGVDVQILGIGANGHIGFNEPSSSLSSRTRLVALTPSTRRSNARFFPQLEEVPRLALTQGVGTILDAREIVLVASGAAKAQAVARAVEGPVAANCPASALQLHPRASWILDREAASELRDLEYYRLSAELL